MTQGGFLSRVRTELPTLPRALQRVAEQILDDPDGTARGTIVDLARRAGTSTATVTRFCRVFGYSGYSELRVTVATETGRAAQARWDSDIDREISPTDDLAHLRGVVAQADARAIQDTAEQVDLGAIERVAGAVGAAGRVELFGLGSSGTAAKEMAFRLERIRIPCWFRADPHTALTNAALLGEGDVAIGISHSGRTREVIETLAEASSHGALAVAVTSFSRSPVTQIADVVLTTAAPETTFRLAALSALHSQLLVLDLVYVAVAQHEFARTLDAFEVTARAVQNHRMPDDGLRRGRRPHRQDPAR